MMYIWPNLSQFVYIIVTLRIAISVHYHIAHWLL